MKPMVGRAGAPEFVPVRKYQVRIPPRREPTAEELAIREHFRDVRRRRAERAGRRGKQPYAH